MKYTNPFDLFGIRPGQKPSGALLQSLEQRVEERARKEEPVFWKPGYQLPKMQLLQFLEELDKAEDYQKHLAIYEDKYLLRFLETGHPGWLKQEQIPAYSGDFWLFIAPYFDYQASEHIEDAAKKNQLEEVAPLYLSLELPSDLLPKLRAALQGQNLLELQGDDEQLPSIEAELNQEQFFGHTEAIDESDPVRDSVLSLKKLKGDSRLSYMSERELCSFIPDSIIKRYNQLSDNYQKSRNYLAREIMFFSEMLIHEYGRQDGAEALLRQALKLKLDEQQKQELEHMISHYSFRRQIPPWLLWGLILVSGLFLLKYIETLFS